MTKQDNIGAQIEFLLMHMLLDPKRDYKTTGFDLDNAVSYFNENKENWWNVARVGDGKDARNNLKFYLYKLKDEGCLSVDRGTFTMGRKSTFNDGFKKRVALLYRNLEMEFGDDEFKYSRRELFRKIAEGEIDVEVVRTIGEKNIHLFTPEQLIELAKYSVQLLY